MAPPVSSIAPDWRRRVGSDRAGMAPPGGSDRAGMAPPGELGCRDRRFGHGSAEGSGTAVANDRRRARRAVTLA
jgi:hypothetical protein